MTNEPTPRQVYLRTNQTPTGMELYLSNGPGQHEKYLGIVTAFSIPGRPKRYVGLPSWRAPGVSWHPIKLSFETPEGAIDWLINAWQLEKLWRMT